MDTYAEKKRAEFEQMLRRQVIGALDNGSHGTVGVKAKELLESECMTFIPRKVTSVLERPRRFLSNSIDLADQRDDAAGHSLIAGVATSTGGRPGIYESPSGHLLKAFFYSFSGIHWERSRSDPP